MAIGTNVGSDPFWVSDSVLAVLCPRAGTTQICAADLSVAHNASRAAAPPTIVFEQVTHLVHGVSSARVHTGTSRIAFTSTVPLAPRPKSGSSGVVYDSLFVRHWDTYIDPNTRSHLFVADLIVDPVTHKVRLGANITDLFAETPDLETPIPPFGSSSDYSFSPDGNLIVFASRVPQRSAAWSTNTDIYIVRTDGSLPPVPISASNLGYDTLPVFSPDGASIAWLQMQTPQYEADINKIAVFSLETKKTRIVAKKWDRSPESLAFLTNTVLVATAQDRGRHKIFTIDVETGTVEPRTSHASFSGIVPVPGLHALIGLVSSQTAPGRIVGVDAASWAVVDLVDLNAPLIKDIELPQPEDFWFKGAKGDKVHGWLLKPPGFVKNGTYPLAFLIHGGPEGAWNDDWSTRWNPQVFAAQGFVVATINFHGSTGFGGAFTRAIRKHWGGAPYLDLVKGLRYVLKNNKQIDSRRIAGLGASYGGYMINWLNGHSRDFACLVNHDGIFDTVSMYYSTEELWFQENEFGGTPFDRKARVLYDKWSPSKYLHRWETPTLVIHGEKDYRVPLSEGLSTFTALQRRGVPSRLLYFPDENHWVLKPANSLMWHATIFDWIHKYTSKEYAETRVPVHVDSPVAEDVEADLAAETQQAADVYAEAQSGGEPALTVQQDAFQYDLSKWM
nr:hypothetical protein HK105_006912 [Polyrhizophydium stewartii]